MDSPNEQKAGGMLDEIKGKVKQVIRGDVVSEVDVETPWGIVTSVITTRSVDDLQLKPGVEVVALVKATERFEAVLSRHARAVEAARVISEGLVQAIAGEVAAARAMGSGYGASGKATAGDGRAITLNRNA